MNMENLTALSYDLRKDVIDMICAGKAGHIGGDMSVMDTLTALYFNQMNVTPDNMDDPNHDRFGVILPPFLRYFSVSSVM